MRLTKLEEKIVLTMDDVRKTNHNLNGDDGVDFVTYRDWEEDDTFEIRYQREQGTWQGKQIITYDIEDEGFAVSIDGEIKHIIGISDPHAAILVEKEGVVAACGHEELITLSLATGEFKETYTR